MFNDEYDLYKNMSLADFVEKKLFDESNLNREPQYTSIGESNPVEENGKPIEKPLSTQEEEVKKQGKKVEYAPVTKLEFSDSVMEGKAKQEPPKVVDKPKTSMSIEEKTGNILKNLAKSIRDKETEQRVDSLENAAKRTQIRNYMPTPQDKYVKDGIRDTVQERRDKKEFTSDEWNTILKRLLK